MKGQIDILSCNDGHAEIHVNASDPISLTRAERIIQDMLRRGYALFVTGADGALIRVKSFDPVTKCYVIGDGPLYAGEVTPATEERKPATARQLDTPPRTKGKRGPGPRKVPVADVHTTAVPRSAGG